MPYNASSQSTYIVRDYDLNSGVKHTDLVPKKDMDIMHVALPGLLKSFLNA